MGWGFLLPLDDITDECWLFDCILAAVSLPLFRVSPLGGSQRLPRAVGFAAAKEMIFTGQRLGGERALQLGLVNRAVEQNSDGDAAYRAALGLAREILPQVSRVACLSVCLH